MITNLDIKELIILTIAFMAFTVIGTISHEYGHIIVAKYLGYDTQLHYGSMNYSSELEEKLIDIYNKNKDAIKNNTPFDQKKEYDKGVETLRSNALWIRLGGPIQTIGIGIIGLTLLLWRRPLMIRNGLSLIDWLCIFLSLFWLREIFNLLMSVGSEMISPNGSYFGGDEKYISFELGLWEGTVPIIIGTLGLSISLFVIFRCIPNRFRSTFIASGFIGGILGFVLWLKILGPKILP